MLFHHSSQSCRRGWPRARAIEIIIEDHRGIIVRYRGAASICGVTDLHIVDDELRWEVRRRSSYASSLGLHDHKHGLAHALGAASPILCCAIHGEFDIVRRPDHCPSVVISIYGVTGVTVSANAETRIGDVKLAPPSGVVALQHVDLVIATIGTAVSDVGAGTAAVRRTDVASSVTTIFVAGLTVLGEHPNSRPGVRI